MQLKWVDNFVNQQLWLELSSWVEKFNSLFPRYLLFQTTQIGETCFISMGVTMNYRSKSHMNDHGHYSIIAWFIQGELFLLRNG